MKQQQSSAEGRVSENAAPPSKGSGMKARLVTAAFYVIVIAGLIILKWLVPEYGQIGFDVLFWAISIIGAYEFMRAVGNISDAQWRTTMLTCILIIPSFVITKMVAKAAGSEQASELALIALMSVSSVGTMITAALLVFDIDRSSLRSTVCSVFCILYCGVLGCVGSNINHMAENSLPAIMLLFFLTTGVDTFAFLFGRFLKKYIPFKLAPKTSPNKTVIGAIGGLVGGVTAAVVTWLCCENVAGMELTYSGSLHPLVLLILISIPTSIFAQLGDLFESAIKRGCGVKDMGRLLPGHGGVLDRFDSMLFAAISIVVCFIIVR